MFRGSWTFLDFLARVGIADLRAEQFSSMAARRFRRNQINGTIGQMRVMMPCNTFFAPALSFQAWNNGVNGLVIGWTIAMLIFSWWQVWAWRTAYPSDSSRKDMRRFVLETYVNSSLWVIGFLCIYPNVEGDQKAIVAAVMAGSLAIGTIGFSRCPGAAFAYASTQTIGNTLVATGTGMMGGNLTDYVLAFLIFTAGLSVLNAVIERGKASVAAFQNLENLAEKTEVIDLLLKDYEEQTTQWVWQTDADGNIERAPVQVLALLDLPPDKAPHTNLLEAVAEKTTPDCRPDVDKLRRALSRITDFHDITLSLRDPANDQVRWIVMKGRPQLENGKYLGFRGIFADATATIEAKRQVQYLATHDSLTKLGNRNSVKQELAALQADRGHAAAFLIDLDGFKQVNDSYGHLVGDRLLEIVAERLKAVAPPGSLVARLGGDEFFVLQTGEESLPLDQLGDAADAMVDSLSDSFSVEEYRLQISASVGIARFPENTKIGTDLLSMADLALYEAKHKGRNRSEFFEAELQDALNSRLVITEKLKVAVREGLIRPHYQCQHALGDGRLIGFEALARWHDDAMGSIGPDIFIPIAEQTGLVVDLGEQILRQACSDMANWVRLVPGTDVIMSVNFSPVQFSRTNVPDTVARVLQETGLPPQHLEIEVTEGVLISDRARVAAALRAVADLGVSIALDDFGTGYSSLSYLKDLPLNRLKIDQSFVNDLSHEATNPIVEAVVRLGQSLGLSVIAEGIEYEEQRQKLQRLGCADGQGYFYGRPVASDVARSQFVEMTDQGLPRSA